MDFCSSTDPCCKPCKPVMDSNWSCSITPSPNVFVDVCNPCESNVFVSPICNTNLVLTGASNCDFLFCTEGSELKCNNLEKFPLKIYLIIEKMKLYVADD